MTSIQDNATNTSQDLSTPCLDVPAIPMDNADPSIDNQPEPHPNGSTALPVIELTDPSDVDVVAEVVRMFLLAQGRASRAEIRRYCGDAGISTGMYQKAMEFST